jgi:lipopolysaccharide export system permease protein
MNSSIIRYVTKELLGWFSLWLVLLTMLLVIILVGIEAVRTNLGLGPILRMLPFVLPTAMAFAVPGTILFTVCSVYGRMSADNEVVATKALGISPLSLLWPAYTLAFLLSLLGVWLNDLAFSWGQLGMQRVVIQSVEEIVYGMLRTNKAYANQRFSIVVKDVQGRRLIDPYITFQASNDLPAVRIKASEAELQTNLDRNTMTLILDHFELKVGDDINMVFPTREAKEYPLEFLSTRESKQGSPATLPISQIPAEIALQQRTIEELEQSLAAEAALSLVTGQFGELREAAWKQRRGQLAAARVRLARLHTEPWRRWAAGFSSLAFVMVGAPLAIMLRKSDVWSTFGLVFLPILFLYYPLFLGCFDRAKAGSFPPFSLWTANFVLAVLGIWLVRRVIRY